MFSPGGAPLSWVFARSPANHFTFLVWIFQLFISYFHSSPSKFRLECCHDFSFQPFYMVSVGISFPEFRIFKIFFFSSVFRLLNRFVAVADLFLEKIILSLGLLVLKVSWVASENKFRYFWFFTFTNSRSAFISQLL